ncbi:Uncharacterized protein dnm_091090 [Desulfonema magnum]|uniref:Uncharacterized protein n=1 Tax=Desulfonema magnum TaxID=45655 RepID=A0A975BWG0_9BACT|nr:Uncharacterized protein dnm_091090 [Desulfonema magnum]
MLLKAFLLKLATSASVKNGQMEYSACKKNLAVLLITNINQVLTSNNLYNKVK